MPKTFKILQPEFVFDDPVATSKRYSTSDILFSALYVIGSDLHIREYTREELELYFRAFYDLSRICKEKKNWASHQAAIAAQNAIQSYAFGRGAIELGRNNPRYWKKKLIK